MLCYMPYKQLIREVLIQQHSPKQNKKYSDFFVYRTEASENLGKGFYVLLALFVACFCYNIFSQGQTTYCVICVTSPNMLTISLLSALRGSRMGQCTKRGFQPFAAAANPPPPPADLDHVFRGCSSPREGRPHCCKDKSPSPAVAEYVQKRDKQR